MKIAIVTVYNSPNFGSNWQARALYTYLKTQGHDVFVYDTGARSVWKKITKPAVFGMVKSLLTIKFQKALFHFRKLKAFYCNFHSLNIIDRMKDLNACDVAVFGSDEIWNVTRDEMRNYPVFFGKGVNTPVKISYATSINNATSFDLESFGIGKYLDSFAYISVRDLWSKCELATQTKLDISIVLDPTFLLDQAFYSTLPRKPIGTGYIGVYYFNPDKALIEMMKKICAMTGKKILSIGTWFEWCDTCVVGENPFLYYYDVDFIVTNTFHGTAFAINFNRPFVTFAKGKQKIKELLHMFELDFCQADEMSVENIVEIMQGNAYDWEKINDLLYKKRTKSQEFLSHALESR